MCVFVDTYVVANLRIILGWESGVWLRLLERQKHVREPSCWCTESVYVSHAVCTGTFSLRVNQSRKGWEAKDNGKKSEDAHIGYVRVDEG